MSAADWIAVDWGTSNLRIWAMKGDVPLAEMASDKGMGCLAPAEFEAALLELIAPYLGDGVTPVICCGMVGSRQGWAEAPYQTVPCLPPNGAHATRVRAVDPRIAVFILPGVKQTTPPDVMRGEETQIAGFLRANPGFDGVICLPGTHTKWVQISAGEIVSFRTCMTGEIFALLSGQSVLRHSVSSDGFDADAFAAGVSDAMSRPADLAAQMFRLRAASLVAEMGAAEARARLSGLLIGAELAASKPYWLGQQVALIGARKLSGLYADALAAQGVPTNRADVTRMTLSGLTEAHFAQKETC